MQFTYVWLHLYYHLMPRNDLNIVTLLLPTAGIEPRPPAQQATALSITPLHLGTTGVV